MITSSDIVKLVKLYNIDKDKKVCVPRTKYDYAKILVEYEIGKSIYNKIDELIKLRVLVKSGNSEMFTVNKERVLQVFQESHLYNDLIDVVSQFGTFIERVD